MLFCRFVIAQWRPIAVATLLGSVLLQPPTALGTTPSHPCSLFVDVDGHVSGCDEHRQDPVYGPFLRAATDHAIAMQNAWRKRSTKDLFPELPGEDQLVSMGKKALARELGGQLSQTLTVDSIAAVLIVDPGLRDPVDSELVFRHLGNSVISEYHVARVAKRGKTFREVYWVRYDETWVNLQNRWALGRIQSRSSGHLPAPAGAMGLLRVDPEKQADKEVKETRRTFRPPLEGQILSARDVPSDLKPGDRIGPFSRPCDGDDGRFVYYEREPEPVTMDGTAHLAAYREDATVLLHVFVCRSGKVGWINVVRGSPPSCAMAAAAVSQWLFSPATANEKPIAVWIEVPVEIP